MIAKGGCFGKILRVDLTTGTHYIDTLDEAFVQEYVGGRGFAVKLLWDHLQGRDSIDPLGPDNMLIVAPGPLTGVYLPSSGKNSFAAICHWQSEKWITSGSLGWPKTNYVAFPQ